MLTRRKSQAKAWIEGFLNAAELPPEVLMHILSSILDNNPTFPQLGKLKLVCKAWRDVISSNEAYIDMLRAEKLCALERKAWGKIRSMSPSNKRLPASCTLPFLGKSDGQVTNVPFRIIKSYKRTSLLVLEADHSHATPQQVVSLLQTVCELEGPVCTMLCLIQFAPNSPQDWLDAIKSGAAGITQPTIVQVITKQDGGILMRPKNDKYTCYLKTRT